MDFLPQFHPSGPMCKMVPREHGPWFLWGKSDKMKGGLDELYLGGYKLVNHEIPIILPVIKLFTQNKLRISQNI